MRFQDIIAQSVRICLEVRANCLVSAVLQPRRISIGSNKPFVSRVWVIGIYPHPMRPMPSHRVRITARYRTHRRFFAILGIIPLVEFSINHCTTRSVNLDGGTTKHECLLAAWSNLVKNSNHSMVGIFSLK